MDKERAPACDRCKEKKVKCDRGQPQCRNCQRSNLPCESLSQKKRTNPTKQLASDFEKIAARLDELDKTVLRSATAVEQLLASHPNGSSTGSGHESQTGPFSTTLNEHGEEEEELGPGLPSFSVNRSGHEIYHGPSSLLALLGGARKRWLDSLEKERIYGAQPGDRLKRNQDLLLEEDFLTLVQQKFQEAFEKASLNDVLELSNDGQAMVLPPRSLLDALSGPFFEHVNPILPVFGKDSFTAAANRIYVAPPNQIDVAWALLFNNIILSTLPIHSGPSSDAESKVRTKMAADLARPFIVNARRALARLDILLSPRLECVQAMLSFCVLSSKNLQLRSGHFFLHQACTLAKVIGLHQQSYSKTERTAPEVEERRNTFWALFILDKQMSLLLSSPCLLPSRDVSVPMPAPRPENPLYGHFVARIQMARIKERIYSDLYSAEGGRKSAKERQAATARLNDELQQWHAEHLGNLQASQNGSWAGTAFINVELMHSYYTSKILILRWCTEPGSLAKRLEAARSSIQFMAQSRKAKLSVGGFMVLRRPFQFYPFAPFLEIFSNFSSYPLPVAPLNDLDLLRSSVDMLREVISPEFSTTYCARLFEVASTCTEIASSHIEHVEERRNARSKPSHNTSSTQNGTPTNSFRTRLLPEPSLAPAFTMEARSHPTLNSFEQAPDGLNPTNIQSQSQSNPAPPYPPQPPTLSSIAHSNSFSVSQPTPQPAAVNFADQQSSNSANFLSVPLSDIDVEYNSFGDSMDFGNFGAFDFDMETLWGDSQLLEEMARDTNTAVLANGVV